MSALLILPANKRHESSRDTMLHVDNTRAMGESGSLSQRLAIFKFSVYGLPDNFSSACRSASLASSQPPNKMNGTKPRALSSRLHAGRSTAGNRDKARFNTARLPPD